MKSTTAFSTTFVTVRAKTRKIAGKARKQESRIQGIHRFLPALVGNGIKLFLVVMMIFDDLLHLFTV